MSVEQRRVLIEPEHVHLSIVRQCALVSISRSSFYHRPAGETAETLALMRLIDAQFLETPWYGSRQMARHLRRDGHEVGRERVRRLMTRMGWRRSTNGHARRCRIPSTGSTTICCGSWWGFLYLVAVMNGATRKVLAWRVSNTMGVAFCVEALQEALARFGRPANLGAMQEHRRDNTDLRAANSPRPTSPPC